ncbi:MAG: PHP domain-containing protein [Armatimonadetes bacterium]|nr:PHP domain-containing protein [Armatimonadota bacterium]
MKIDLHTHTNYSDGELTPQALVKQAVNLGLETLAITDHDSVEGIKEALTTSLIYKIEIIPAIELNTNFYGEEIHILGYFIDYQNIKFKKELQKLQNNRIIRAKKILKKLENLKIFLSWEKLLKSKVDSLGRPHIAQLLVKSGEVNSLHEAFDKYLKKDAPAYVPLLKLTPQEGISLILKFKGVPVLAHPQELKNAERIILKLKEARLLGIEAFSPRASLIEERFYLKLAQKNNLLITAGSDFHGFSNNKFNALGIFNFKRLYLENLKTARGR